MLIAFAASPSELKPMPGAVSEKLSMTKRLMRMFTTKDASKSTSETSVNSQPAKRGTSTPQAEPISAPNPNPLTRKTPSIDEVATAPTKSRAATSHAVTRRYIVLPNVPGGHEHKLKSAKRKERLSGMFRGVVGGERRNSGQPEGEQQLSPVSLASDKKGALNSTEIVGRGAFGIVRVSHKRKGNGAREQLYAVKEFCRQPEEIEKKSSKRLASEFCISFPLRHPNVIRTLDLLQDSKGAYCEVMEFCASGDLYTHILTAGKLEVNEADYYFKQIMRGVESMHEMGVAHRDLKPENLLLTAYGCLKIADFENVEYIRMAGEVDAHMVTSICGSAPYIAPEEYIDKEFDGRPVDVWATGVIYMAMRTGRHLWRVAKGEEDEFYDGYLRDRREEDGYAPIESLHRARCRNVIYSILDPNPRRRITACQVLRSEWGRDIKLCRAGEGDI
ncbi:kinase-like protein [Leptodontidium sp. MPI-SDFR-AT-0119]|nr:kinase-like protein [Leptodontidium sp. MPI-SDFR-AT-0119]